MYVALGTIRNNGSEGRFPRLPLAVVLLYLGQTKEGSLTMVLFNAEPCGLFRDHV